jgi:hypothetical protein
MEGMTGRLVGAAPGDHLAFTWREESALVESAGLFLVAGLRNGEDARVIATPAHWKAVESYLSRLGVDSAKLRRGGRLQVLDGAAIAEDLLSRKGDPTDEELRHWIRSVLGPETGRALRVYGEAVGLLSAGGKAGLALRLEKAWNTVLAERPFALLCGYAASDLKGAPDSLQGPLAGEHACMPAI